MAVAKRGKAKDYAKKENPDRELARAFTDLTRVFSKKELEKRFKITGHQISTYKRYRKRKPFESKKRRKVLLFYRKLQASKHNEKIRFNYDTRGKKRRLFASKGIPTRKVQSLVKRKGVGIKRLAKEMGVSPDTVRRWSRGKGKLTTKQKNRLYRLSRKYYAHLNGLFFLRLRDEYQKKSWQGRQRGYSLIKYYNGHFYGSESELRGFVIEDNQTSTLIDELIVPRGKPTGGRIGPKERRASSFFNHLSEVKAAGDYALLQRSLINSREFVHANFKGSAAGRLLRKIRRYGK